MKVEISLFLVKTYNVFQHETSDECMDECWKSESLDMGSSGYNLKNFSTFKTYKRFFFTYPPLVNRGLLSKWKKIMKIEN